MRDCRVLMGTVSLLALTAAGVLVATPAADARVTKIQITSKQSPTFGGYAFEGVGRYEKIVGKAFGELDPNNSKNAVIVDIQLAPKNANGKVEYAFDLAHSTAKCNGEIFGVEENLTRSSIAEYLSGTRVEFILDPLDLGIGHNREI